MKIQIFLLFIFISTAINPILLNAEPLANAANAVIFKNGSYFIDYKSVSLDAIIHDIEDAFQISIIPLNTRKKTENISLAINAESIEEVLQKTITSIGENNYAFFYTAGKLAKVYIAPTTGENVSTLEEKGVEKRSPIYILGAEIVSVNGDLDQPPVELKQGDIIIGYDNGMITRGPIELLDLMKKRSDQNAFEIRILRDNIPMSVFVPGGVIDAGLKTIKLDKADF